MNSKTHQSALTFFLTLITLFQIRHFFSQVDFSSPTVAYTQDFSAIPITATDGNTQTWTNNSSLLGWYVSPTTVRVELSPTTSLQNSGAPYIIKNGTDISLGSRASGTSPNNNIYFGVRFKNNTGVILRSLKVEYYGEQYSIAENNGNINNLAFHYQKSSSAITSLTSGSWTALNALNFTQLHSSSDSPAKGGSACSGTSNQCVGLDGNNSGNRSYKSLNFDVTLNPGDEIFLRWYDADNTSNDHHLQVDDLIVTPYEEISSVVLPIDLADFRGTCDENILDFSWETASELNNDFFTLEASKNGSDFEDLAQIKTKGNSSSETKYYFILQNTASNTYFRLKQTDFNGQSRYLKTVFVKCQTDQLLTMYPNPSSTELYFSCSNENRTNVFFISNAFGQLILEQTGFESNYKIDVSKFASGIYFLNLETENGLKSYKFSVNQ